MRIHADNVSHRGQQELLCWLSGVGRSLAQLLVVEIADSSFLQLLLERLVSRLMLEFCDALILAENDLPGLMLEVRDAFFFDKNGLSALFYLLPKVFEVSLEAFIMLAVLAGDAF